jgi:hypothetical protein
MYDASLPGGASMRGDWNERLATSKDCHSHLLGDGPAIY